MDEFHQGILYLSSKINVNYKNPYNKLKQNIQSVDIYFHFQVFLLE